MSTTFLQQVNCHVTRYRFFALKIGPCKITLMRKITMLEAWLDLIVKKIVLV